MLPDPRDLTAEVVERMVGIGHDEEDDPFLHIGLGDDLCVIDMDVCDEMQAYLRSAVLSVARAAVAAETERQNERYEDALTTLQETAVLCSRAESRAAALRKERDAAHDLIRRICAEACEDAEDHPVDAIRQIIHDRDAAASRAEAAEREVERLESALRKVVRYMDRDLLHTIARAALAAPDTGEGKKG